MQFHQQPSTWRDGRPGFKVWVEHAGDRVSQLEIAEIHIGLCGTEVRSAGILDVETAPAHRRQGFGRFLMEEALDLALREGFEISTLFGIPGFYHRFGYVSVGPSFEIWLSAGAVRDPASGMAIRPATDADWPEIARIYARASADLNGAPMRDPASWPGPRQGSFWDVKPTTLAAVDARGSPVGYIMFDFENNGMSITDAAFVDVDAAPVLLNAAARAAVDRGIEDMCFLLHPEKAFGDYLRRFPVRVKEQRPHDTDDMARLLDQRAVLQKVSGELRRRAWRAGADTPSSLTVRTDLGAATVRLGGEAGPLSISLPQQGLIQLLYGYRTPAEIAGMPGAEIPSGALALLETVFPREDSYCDWPDRY